MAKDLHELFDVSVLMDRCKGYINEFVEDEDGEYLSDDNYSGYICTIVPECYGCNQPSAICEFFDFSDEEIFGDDLPFREVDEWGETVYAPHYNVNLRVDREEVINRYEWIYDAIEGLVDEYNDKLNAIRQDKGIEGSIYIGWNDGTFGITFYMDYMEVDDLRSTDERIDAGYEKAYDLAYGSEDED